MKKNMFAAALAAMLLLCLLMAGCGGSQSPETTTEQTQEITSAEETTSREESTQASTQAPTESATQETQPVPEGIQTLEDGTWILPDGHAHKPEYPLNETAVGRAVSRFQYLYDSYLQGTDSKIHVAIIPDKGYYLQDTEVPTMEYAQLFQIVQDGMPYASYIDLTDTLSLDAYYYTDIHWRQEYLWDAADRICQALGVTSPQKEQFTETALQLPFYGMYYDEAAVMGQDTIHLLENSMLNSCTVKHHDTGRTTKVYDRSKMKSETLYDVFLSGATPLLTIENPQATTDRELIVFRDSFGSSMVPLLLQDYATVTLVDIRYVASSAIDRFVEFHGQDVLFLYSTHLINNSSAMK